MKLSEEINKINKQSQQIRLEGEKLLKDLRNWKP